MYFSDDMKALIALFNAHGVGYAFCGDFAVAHYGFVRMTMDFDLLVLPGAENAMKIIRALGGFGFGDDGVSEETFLNVGTAVTLGEQPNQIDLLTSMSTQPTGEVIKNAGRVDMAGLKVNMVTYEDLLAAKREAGRAKDRIDVEELEKLKRDKEKR